MKITCPHCSQHLELDTETLIALEGASHFDCPTCGRAVEVPALVLVPVKQTAPRREAKPTPERVVRGTEQGMNRNMLVLGLVALLAIGGVAVFLASKNGVNIFNSFQNTTQQIINNSYFTQLIADGATTKEDLEAIAEIRPYGDRFIGVSKEAFNWEQAQDLAMRTGSNILSLEESTNVPGEKLMTWITNTFGSHLSSPVWIRKLDQAMILDGGDVVGPIDISKRSSVLVQWQAGTASQNRETVAFVTGLLRETFSDKTRLECIRVRHLKTLPDGVLRFAAILNDGKELEVTLQKKNGILASHGSNKALIRGIQLPHMIVPTSEITTHSLWRFTEQKPEPNWNQPDFDDDSWQQGPAVFGSRAVSNTEWASQAIWLRKKFILPDSPPGALMLRLWYDENVQIYLNGVLAFERGGWTTEYHDEQISAEALAKVKPGENIIAVLCRQTWGGQAIDVGLIDHSPSGHSR